MPYGTSPEEKLLRNIFGEPRLTYDPGKRIFFYLQAFEAMVPTISAWQTAANLSLLIENEDRLRHLQMNCANLHRRHFPILFKVIFTAYYTKQGRPTTPLVEHLLSNTRRPGQFQEVIGFFRDFNALSWEDQHAFCAHIQEDSLRTRAGQRHLQRETSAAPILLNPTKARGRLRRWVIQHFIASLDTSKQHKAQLQTDMQQRVKLWQRGDLLTHLATLTKFSSRKGKDAIVELTQALITDEAKQATAAAGNRRFVNPARYHAMKRVFAADFITHWANSDHDFVIPLGEVDPSGVLATDPLALRRAKYSHAAQQIAAHLDISGASHLDGAELIAAIRHHLNAAAPLIAEAVPGATEWLHRMDELLRKMEQLEELSEMEVDTAIRFLRDQPNVGYMLGSVGGEVLNDLQNLKWGLKAKALSGKAWLIITSDPAELIGAGREPVVTCQDPTRNTGHNQHGQPVNRALEGRFRKAKVVMANHVRIEHGIAVLGANAQDVGRSHLEVTTATGRPNPAARPHLLIDRFYGHPGFIYQELVAQKLNQFATEPLGLDPEHEVHNQFTGQGMSNHPKPLRGRRHIYRDSF